MYFWGQEFSPRKKVWGGNSSVAKCPLRIGRLCGRYTPTEEIAVTLLGQERSPQSPRQGASFRLRPAANCRHQKSH